MTATQLPRVSATPTVCCEPYSVCARTVASAFPPGRARRTTESPRGVAAKNGSFGWTFGFATALVATASAATSARRKGRIEPRSAAIPRFGSLVRGTAATDSSGEAPIVPTMLGRARPPVAPGRRRLRLLSRRFRAGDDELDVLGDTYRGRFLGTEELARWEPEEPLADSARARPACPRARAPRGLRRSRLPAGGRDRRRVVRVLGRDARGRDRADADADRRRVAAGDRRLLPRRPRRDRQRPLPAARRPIARDRLVDADVRLGSARPFGRNRAVEAFLHGLTSPEPELPHGGSTARSRRRSRAGSTRASQRLDPRAVGRRPPPRRARRRSLVLELWLHASDDATVALPASLLWDAGPDAFRFLRDADPYADLPRAFATLRGTLAEHGFTFDDAEPRDAPLDADDAEHFLRRVMPTLPVRSCSRPRGRRALRESAPTCARAHRPGSVRASRLAAPRRRARARRGRAAAPRGRARAARPRRRPLAGAPARRRRACAALSRAEAYRRRPGRPRPRSVGDRDRRVRARARRGVAG